MKIIKKSLLALLLGLSLTACGISRNKIINTEFTRATEAESQVSQFVSGTPSETTSFDYSMVPEYTGSASVAINNNVPFFNADEKAAGDEYIMPCVSIISHFGQIVLFTVSPI